MKRSLMLAVPLLGALVLGAPVSASAGSFTEGARGSAPFSREEGCPVEIESARIVFSVPAFPVEESGESGAGVTAYYTFRNPTKEEKRVRVLFPAGGYTAGAEEQAIVSDGEGSPLECRLRHTYFGIGAAADAVSEERREDAFFSGGTAVSHVSYSYSPPAETERAYLRLALSYNPAKTRIAFDGSPKVSVEDGRVCAVWQTGALSPHFGYYSFGEPAEAEVSVSQDRTRAAVSAEGVESAEETAVLGEFLEERRPAGIGAEDWYNGFVDAMNCKYALGFAFLSLDRFNEMSFLRWWEYDLTVPAEGRAENVVSLSLYPTADEGFDGAAYRYEYLLSPAQSWANVGELEVQIETPYYIYDSSLTFEKGEGGYTFRRAGLPLGELSFTLGEKENPTRVFTSFSFRRPLTVLLIVLAIVAVGLAVAIVIVAVHYSKVKKRAKERAARGSATEGKLPRE